MILVILITGSCDNLLKKDYSLTVKEYQKLGIPDHNRIWTNDDYINSNITLGSIKSDYPLSLPRKNSKKSGAIFSRFINRENLSFTGDTALPLRSRAYLIQHFTRFQGELQQAYSDKTKEEQYYEEELIDIEIFGLFVHERMLSLAEIIMKSTDESLTGIQSGLKTVKYNYLQLIEMLLAEQVRTKAYSTKNLEKLSKEVSRSLIENHEWILPADRLTISAQIQSTIDKSSSKIVKADYQKILNALDDKK
jgi:hypothetical protein